MEDCSPWWRDTRHICLKYHPSQRAETKCKLRMQSSSTFMYQVEFQSAFYGLSPLLELEFSHFSIGTWVNVRILSQAHNISRNKLNLYGAFLYQHFTISQNQFYTPEILVHKDQTLLFHSSTHNTEQVSLAAHVVASVGEEFLRQELHFISSAECTFLSKEMKKYYLPFKGPHFARTLVRVGVKLGSGPRTITNTMSPQVKLNDPYMLVSMTREHELSLSFSHRTNRRTVSVAGQIKSLKLHSMHSINMSLVWLEDSYQQHQYLQNLVPTHCVPKNLGLKFISYCLNYTLHEHKNFLLFLRSRHTTKKVCLRGRQTNTDSTRGMIINKTDQTWIQSSDKCKEIGGSLPLIKSPQLLDTILALVKLSHILPPLYGMFIQLVRPRNKTKVILCIHAESLF